MTKKLNGRTPPKTNPEKNFFEEFVGAMGVLMIVVFIGGFILYEQRQKVNLADKCGELMRYRNDVKLNTGYYWSCEVNGRRVDKDTLDTAIKLYEVRAVMEKTE